MGFFKRNGSADMLNTVAGLLLFLLFAVCSLVIIGAGAGVYSRIQDNHDSTYGSSASIRYITNKIRSGESVEVIGEGSGIVLTDGGIKCIIYAENGGLYEKTVAADADAIADGGDMIFSLDELEIIESKRHYEITVTRGADETTAIVRKG